MSIFIYIPRKKVKIIIIIVITIIIIIIITVEIKIWVAISGLTAIVFRFLNRVCDKSGVHNYRKVTLKVKVAE